jgi:hypothetical protein
MAASKTPLSGASSYRELGEYWDDHDLSVHPSREVEMDVDIQSSVIYFAVEKELAEKLRSAAQHDGVSPETLLNRWVEQHVGGSSSSK